MRNLRNFITVVAISVLPPSAVGQRGKLEGKDGKHFDRGLDLLEAPYIVDVFDRAHEDSGIPGFNQDNEKIDMWHTREQTWRTEPRINRNGGKGGAPKWSWKDIPCVPKKKKSKKTSLGPTPAPSQQPSSHPTSTPSSFPTGPTSVPPKSSKKSPKVRVCPEGPGFKDIWLPGGDNVENPGDNIDIPGENIDIPGDVAPTPPPDIPADIIPSPSASPSAAPLGGDGGVGVPGLDEETCAVVEAQDGYTVDNDATLSNLIATLSITFQTVSSSGILSVLNGEYRSVIALWVAGCEARAIELAGSLRRQLQTEDAIDYVGLTFSSVNDACNGVTPPPDCTEEFRGAFTVYHFIATDGNDILKNRIEEAFARFPELLPKLASDAGLGVVEVSVDDVVPTENDADQAVAPPGSTFTASNVAVVIGASAGGLAFLLLLVLLVRRKQVDEEISHLKLEEDQGDDTFIREFASTASSPSRDEDYEARNAHVVGEADSIFSGWTGYTARDRKETDIFDHGDVHKCSSATCEVCEQRRQQGIQFIPTGTPVRPQLPTDSSRDYVEDDTIEL